MLMCRRRGRAHGKAFPKMKKREKKSIPLERSVHINDERWGWEVKAKDYRRDDDVSHIIENAKIKILSPDNKYYEVSLDKFFGFTALTWKPIMPSKVKSFIIKNLMSK